MQLRAEDGRSVWLGYGMNVHPGGDAESFIRALDDTVRPMRERLGGTGPFGLAVRFHADAVEQLVADDALRHRIGARLRDEALVPFTGNAFVMGTFHGRPLKDQVYRPSWASPARTAYTLQFAELLTAWCGDEDELSLSTAPGGWRGWRGWRADEAACAANLAATAVGLKRLHEQTGVGVRLGLEPEPRCTLETIDEARAFFHGPLARALGDDPDLGAYLGICYDVCHQAVMHEDPAVALGGLGDSGIPVVKLQASNALEIVDPTDPTVRKALLAFDEPVYLHQVAAPDETGTVHVETDLGAVLHDPSGRWAARRPWRIHFHVPVDRAGMGGVLGTTHADLAAAVRVAVGKRLTSHFEIETYTWAVLPEADVGRKAGKFDLADALTLEFEHLTGLLGAEGFVPV